MIITTRFADASQAHLVKAPGAARTQLTFYKERVSSPSYDPVNGDFIIFPKDTGGDENYQIYRNDFASGKTTLLTDGLSRNIGGVWSNKGDRLAYESNRRDKNDMDIHVMDPRDPGSDRLLLQVKGGAWGALDWSPDDGRLLVQEGISINESYLWLVDVASGQKELLTPKGKKEKIAYNYAAFSSDGKGIYALTDKDSEFVRLAYIDLATRKHTYLTSAIPWDIDEFALSYDRSRIAFVSNEEGANVLRVRDLASGKELPVPAMPLGLISGLQWHAQRPRYRLHLSQSAFGRRRLFAGYRKRQGRTLDGQRTRRPEQRNLRHTGTDQVEELRPAGRSPAFCTARPPASPASGR